MPCFKISMDSKLSDSCLYNSVADSHMNSSVHSQPTSRSSMLIRNPTGQEAGWEHHQRKTGSMCQLSARNLLFKVPCPLLLPPALPRLLNLLLFCNKHFPSPALRPNLHFVLTWLSHRLDVELGGTRTVA